MKVVILGCGRVGSTLANLLAEENHDVTIIDKNPDSFRRLPATYKGKKVLGWGVDVGVLKKAGIETADVFVSTTTGDNTGIMASQMAKEIFKVKKVITRIYDPIRAEAYKEMGLETYCPTILGARLIMNTILGKKANIEKIKKLVEEG